MRREHEIGRRKGTRRSTRNSYAAEKACSLGYEKKRRDKEQKKKMSHENDEPDRVNRRNATTKPHEESPKRRNKEREAAA